jgi:subtilisin family serine protease
LEEIPAVLNRTTEAIRKLAADGVVVCVPTGSNYAKYNKEGVAFPAIIPETISVGAMCDVDFSTAGPRKQGKALFTVSNADIFSAKPGQITPFTQRLSSPTGRRSRTDIFAPGLSVVSSGSSSEGRTDPSSIIVLSGTSPACAFVAGAAALLHERALALTKLHGEADWLPPTSLVEDWLREGGVNLTSMKDAPTTFVGLNVDGALNSLQKLYERDKYMYEQAWILHAQSDSKGAFRTDLTILGRKVEPPDGVGR